MLPTCQAGAALAVAHVGLDRANEQRVCSASARAATVHEVDGRQLLRVAHHGARAVRLHVGDVLPLNSVHAAPKISLGLAFGTFNQESGKCKGIAVITCRVL